MRYIMNFLLATLLTLSCASQALASPVLGHGTNTIRYNYSMGVSNVAGGNANVIEAGDTFYGVMSVQEIETNNQTSWDDTLTGPSTDAINGYFVATVTSVSTVTVDGATLYLIALGAASSDPNNILSDEELDAGVVMKLFNSSTSADGMTPSQALSTVASGTPWLSLTSDNGYMYLLSTSTSLSSRYFMGNLVTGLNVEDAYDSQADRAAPSPYENNPLYGTPGYSQPVDAYSDAGVYKGSGGWSLEGEGSMTVVVLPEPSTLALVGLSLGLGAFAKVLRRLGR